MQLSQLDLKLLRYLKFQGLKPITIIAKELRLSPATVLYKLKKFEEENVIIGYKYRVNYQKIGLNKLSWIFLIADYKHGLELDKLVNFLTSNENVHSVFLLTGIYDMMLKMYTRNFETISDFIFKMKRKLKGALRSVNTMFSIKTYKLNQKPVDESVNVKLSKIELKILKYILANPYAKIKDISNSLKLHRNTVSLKFKKLMNSGVIIKKVPIINPEFEYDIGIAFKAFVFIDAEGGCVEELAKNLVKCEAVHELFATSTDHDLFAVIRTKSMKEFSEFHKMLYSDPKFKSLVYDAKSLCVLDVLKDRSDDPSCLKSLI